MMMKKMNCFPTINNKYNIFNDNTFRDSYATLKVYTPLYQEYYPIEGHYYDHISCKQNHHRTVV